MCLNKVEYNILFTFFCWKIQYFSLLNNTSAYVLPLSRSSKYLIKTYIWRKCSCIEIICNRKLYDNNLIWFTIEHTTLVITMIHENNSLTWYLQFNWIFRFFCSTIFLCLTYILYLYTLFVLYSIYIYFSLIFR